MKPILDLTKALLDKEYLNSQCDEFGKDKNILFLNPQLSGKYLYKSILPYFCMYNETIFTAMTGITKYDPIKQLEELDVSLNSSQIMWADFIVIPFTTESLTEGETNLYQAIRDINDECKIVFSIDFNFYELSETHPYKKIFTKTAIDITENNIWFSDVCLISNIAFRTYLIDKLKLLFESKYKDKPSSVSIACMPFIIDSEIVLANIDYDLQEPQKKKKIEHNVAMEERMKDLNETVEEIKKVAPKKKTKKKTKIKKDGKSKRTTKSTSLRKPKSSKTS